MVTYVQGSWISLSGQVSVEVNKGFLWASVAGSLHSSRAFQHSCLHLLISEGRLGILPFISPLAPKLESLLTENCHVTSASGRISSVICKEEWYWHSVLVTLFIAMTKYLAETTWGRTDFLWLIVSEVSIQGHLDPLFWVWGKASIMASGVCGRSCYLRAIKETESWRDREGLGTRHRPQGHVLIDLLPPTRPTSENFYHLLIMLSSYEFVNGSFHYWVRTLII
jgi:hypothetical protein